ncbi:dienelactone hydrolase family protein [Bacteriovoracales bacterium]|nr:dienelactone hydrolase family protein [Bacteriovoracales bacterium]
MFLRALSVLVVFICFPFSGKSSLSEGFRKEVNLREASLETEKLVIKTIKMEKYKGSYKALNTVDGSRISHDFVYYRPKGINNRKTPLIIIVPPVVGITPFEYMSARYFSSHGFAVAVLKLNVPSVDQNVVLDRLGQDWEGYVEKVRAFIDIVGKLPGVDDQKIGIMGLSLGGITTALTMGRDPRLKAGVIFMGATNIPHLMAYSDQYVVKKLREKKMSELGIEDAWDFETLLKEKVKIDLPYLTEGRTSRDYFLFVTKDDSYVPSKIQETLRADLGYPETHYLPPGHVLNGMFYPVHLKKMKDYYWLKLGQ